MNNYENIDEMLVKDPNADEVIGMRFTEGSNVAYSLSTTNSELMNSLRLSHTFLRKYHDVLRQADAVSNVQVGSAAVSLLRDRVAVSPSDAFTRHLSVSCRYTHR